MPAPKSLQTFQKNPGVQTKLCEKAGHPRWQRRECWKIKNPAQQQHAENKVSKYRNNCKRSVVQEADTEKEKKNLNKCKFIQFCLLKYLIIFSSSAALAALCTWAPRGISACLHGSHYGTTNGPKPGVSKRQHLADLSWCRQLFLFCPQLNWGGGLGCFFPPVTLGSEMNSSGI